MAEIQHTYTLRAVVKQVLLDPVSSAVILSGDIVMVETNNVIAQYQENVTALMNQAQIDAALLLVSGAQGWIDTKLPA